MKRYTPLLLLALLAMLASKADAFTRYQVIRLTSHDNIVSYEALPATDVKVMEKAIRSESRYFSNSLKKTKVEWAEQLDQETPTLIPGLVKRKLVVVKSSTKEQECAKWRSNYEARLETERKDEYEDIRKKVDAKFPLAIGGAGRNGEVNNDDVKRRRDERYAEEISKLERKRSVLSEAADMLSAHIAAAMERSSSQKAALKAKEDERNRHRLERAQRSSTGAASGLIPVAPAKATPKAGKKPLFDL
jgi:hypothetical protein